MTNVLIVEDDAPLASFYSRILEFNGYTPNWAKSCEQAIDYVGQSCPDVVLLDVILPDGNGLDIIKWMNTDQNCVLPTVVVVSSGDFKPEAEARGIANYLTKPVSMDTLLQTLAAAVDQHQ